MTIRIWKKIQLPISVDSISYMRTKNKKLPIIVRHGQLRVRCTRVVHSFVTPTTKSRAYVNPLNYYRRTCRAVINSEFPSIQYSRLCRQSIPVACLDFAVNRRMNGKGSVGRHKWYFSDVQVKIIITNNLIGIITY